MPYPPPHTLQHTHTHTYIHSRTYAHSSDQPPCCSSSLSSSQVTASIYINGYLTIILQCVHNGMMCQVMVQDLTCIIGVGGVYAWLGIFCDYTFTNKPRQTQSWVDNLKNCLVFLEKFWHWNLCGCSEHWVKQASLTEVFCLMLWHGVAWQCLLQQTDNKLRPHLTWPHTTDCLTVAAYNMHGLYDQSHPHEVTSSFIVQSLITAY